MRVHRLRDLEQWQRAVFAAMVAGTVAVAVVYLLRLHSFTPIGDDAKQVWGALRAFKDRPLVGDVTSSNLYGNPPSHHPGPFAYYAEAPFVLLFGARVGAPLFGLTVQLGSLLLAGWVAFRQAGFRAGVVMFAAGVLAVDWLLGGQLGTSHIHLLPVGPLFLCLVAAWGVARGDAVALGVFVVAASFVAQTEVLYVPLLAGVGAVAAGSYLRSGVSRGFWVCAGILAALWVPTVLDQVNYSRNLSALASTSIPHSGWGAGWDFTVGTFRLALVPLLAVIAWRRPKGFLPLGLVVAATVVGVFVVGALLPVGDPERYHGSWTPAVAWWLVGAGTIAAASGVVLPRFVKAVAMVAVAVLLVGRIPDLTEYETVSPIDRVEQRAVVAVAPDVYAHIRPGTDTAVTDRGGWAPAGIGEGLVPLMEEHGRQAAVSDQALLIRDNHLVVTWAPTPYATGKVIATYRGSKVDPAPLQRWARTHDWELTADGRANLSNLVDGLAPKVCVADLVKHPDRLLSLSPDMGARLVSLRWIEAPVKERDLADRWQAAQTVEVREVPGRDGLLVFSKSSC